MPKIIGVLALQGAVREHVALLERCGARGIAVKHPRELASLDGLIIPGGESTTIGKMMERYEFLDTIAQLGKDGFPIFGTCAGAILLAAKVTEGTQPLLSLMDIEMRRNAFGRQRESFEADLGLGELSGGNGAFFRGVFIRAPWIERVWGKARMICVYEGKGVLARQEKLLASAFHPELTDDTRVHRYFLKEVI